MTQRQYIRDGRAPIPKSERTSRTMSAIRAKNTKPELLVRKMLRKAGLTKYCLHPKNLPGRPDIGFPKSKVSIFVHGCFWHGCRYCKPKLPKSHRAFWRKKIERNRERDTEKVKALKKVGWKVVTIWACKLSSERTRSLMTQKIVALF